MFLVVYFFFVDCLVRGSLLVFVYYMYYIYEDVIIILYWECFIVFVREIIEDLIFDCNELNVGMIYLLLKDKLNFKIFL